MRILSRTIYLFCMLCANMPVSAQVLFGDESVAKPSLPSSKSEGGCLSASTNASSRNRVLFPTTGVVQWDNQMNLEVTLLRTIFKVQPNIFLYDDSGSKNAYATPSDPNNPDGKVVFGLTLLGEEMQTKNYNGLAVPIIMAHEFGHSVQFAKQIRLNGKYVELDADYLAGWYMGNRVIKIGGNLDGVIAIAQKFYEMGDRGFFSTDPHGTPLERKQALLEGLTNYKLDISSATKRSIEYIDKISKKE